MNPARYLAAFVPMVLFAPAMAGEAGGDAALLVVDLRPQEERGGTGITPLAGECNQDVYRIADAASKPLKVAALKADLAAKLGQAGAAKTLTVMNWTIYYNKQLYGGQPWGKIVGVGGISIPGSNNSQGGFPGSKCSPQESAGGWFDRTEVTGKYSPLISVFEGTFAGQRVGVRIVHSPKRKLDGKFAGGAIDSLAVLDAVHETAEALVAILPVSRQQ